MKKNNVPSPRFFLKLLAATAAIFLAGGAQAATVTRTILNDGSTTAFEHPDVAVDSVGNLHIVAQGVPATTFNRTSEEIYYIRVSPSGTVLTPLTQISTTNATRKARPYVVTTSGNKAVVAWKDASSNTVAVLVNPAAVSIVEVTETIVAAATSYGHFSMAVDSSDKVHLIGDNGTNLFHVRFSGATLVADVAKHALTPTTRNRENNTSVAVGPGNNLHVTFCSGVSGNPAYLMLDNSGTILIGETALFDRGGTSPQGQHVYVAADANGVYAVYSDKRDTLDFDTQQGGAVFYSKLNPALNTNAAGTPADINVIRVGSEIRLGNVWYAKGFRGSDGVIRAVAGAGNKGNGDLNYFALNGTTVSSAQITAQNDAYNYYRKMAAGAGNAIVWAEGIYSPTLMGTTLQLVMASVSAFDSATAPVIVNNDSKNFWGCSMSPAGTRTPVDPVLPLLAVLSALYLARRRPHAGR